MNIIWVYVRMVYRSRFGWYLLRIVHGVIAVIPSIYNALNRYISGALGRCGLYTLLF